MEFVKNNKKSYFTQKLFPFLFIRNWWVLLVFFSSFITYDVACKKKSFALAEIDYRIQEMEKEKSIVMATHEDLMLRINSSADPSHMEMVLMKELGLVPEGKIKVRFASDE